MKTVFIRVTGKVQGVFYRKSAKDAARVLGVTGWVRNEDDGSVSIEASGTPDAIAKLIEWCRQGSPRAVVTDVKAEDLPYREHAQFISER